MCLDITLLSELRMKWFCQTVCGNTKDPGCKLFRRFQAAFVNLEEQMTADNLVRLDLSTRPEWVQELAIETLAWAQDVASKAVFPRDDYAEFLHWVIWHLGGVVRKGFFPLKMPGPDHNARWMAKCIYNCKILACSKIFQLSEDTLKKVELCTEFTVLFYARGWFEAPLAAVAAISDLTFISHVLRYYRLSVAYPLLQECYRQLWYLTGELVVFALVDDGLPVE